MLKLMLKRFFRNPLAMSGAFIIFILFMVAVFAPWIATHDPLYQNPVSERLDPPSSLHILGTDDLGRDLFSRIVFGTRVSISVGFVSVSISVFIGGMLGLMAGYFGGKTDAVIMRLVDIMLCFPTFFLILMVIAFLEPNIWYVMAAIGLTSWPGLARMVRGECLSIREREYILAARAMGLSHMRIIVVHLLPNVVAPILVVATLGVGSSILTESALSFLGLGVQPPIPSWGNILTLGKDNISIAWWLSLFPGIAIFITVFAYNLLGEGLRDIFDPRLGD